MRSTAARTRRAWLAASLAVLLVLSLVQVATAHTGEGVSLDHVVIEIGTWALAIVGVIAVIVGIFWVRARYRRGE